VVLAIECGVGRLNITLYAVNEHALVSYDLLFYARVLIVGDANLLQLRGAIAEFSSFPLAHVGSAMMVLEIHALRRVSF